MKAEASKLLAKRVDGMQDSEAFISLFDLSSDKIAEDALGAVLAERPELFNDIDLSTGEKTFRTCINDRHTDSAL